MLGKQSLENFVNGYLRKEAKLVNSVTDYHYVPLTEQLLYIIGKMVTNEGGVTNELSVV